MRIPNSFACSETLGAEPLGESRWDLLDLERDGTSYCRGATYNVCTAHLLDWEMMVGKLYPGAHETIVTNLAYVYRLFGYPQMANTEDFAFFNVIPTYVKDYPYACAVCAQAFMQKISIAVAVMDVAALDCVPAARRAKFVCGGCAYQDLPMLSAVWRKLADDGSIHESVLLRKVKVSV